jgi:anti-sigma B factor antagonist
MTITVRSLDLITIVDLDGRLVAGDGVQLLKDKINSLVFQNHRELLINLARVQYIDSSGLGELVGCLTTVARAGGHLKLLHVNGRNRDLLALTKLLTAFDVFESEADAIRSFAAVGA